MSGLFGSSNSTQPANTVTQTSDPWSGAQPGLTSMYNSAEHWRNNNIGYLPFTGSTQVQMDPNLGNAVSQNIAMAMQDVNGTPGVTAARNFGTNIINTGGGPENPYLQAMLASSNQRIGDRINSSMSGAGRYASGQHTDVMARALAEAANPVLAEDYNRRQERVGQWAQLMPTLDQARYSGVDRLQGVGQFLTNRNQLALQDQIKLYEAQQAYPWEQLARQAAIMGGAGQLGGTKTTVSNPYQPSMLQRGFGGAVAGAGVGSLFGLPGAGVGALGGGLLGLLS